MAKKTPYNATTKNKKTEMKSDLCGKFTRKYEEKV